MSKVRLLSPRTILLGSTVAVMVAVCGIVLSPQKTSAYSGGIDCVGTSAGNFNLVIFTRVLNSDGSVASVAQANAAGISVDSQGYANYFKFTVQSFKNTAAAAGERAEYDKWKFNSILYRNNGSAKPLGDAAQTMTVRRASTTNTNSQTAMYDGQGNICERGGQLHASYAFRDGDQTSLGCFPSAAGKTRTGCGYDASINRPEADNNYSRVLSCLASDATGYIVSSPQMPGATGGGWYAHPVLNIDDMGGVLNTNWTGGTKVAFYTDTGYEVNSREKRIVFHYKLPAPPPSASTSVTPSVTINPNPVEQGGQYTAEAKLQNNSSTPAIVTGTLEVWLDSGDQIRGAGDSVIPNPPFTAIPVPGNSSVTRTYTGTVTGNYRYVCSHLRNLTGLLVTFTPPDSGIVCVSIARLPYFEVQNGDINTTCGAGGAIAAWWNPTANSGLGNGSGAQGAAFVGGTITGFASRLGRMATPAAPKDLTFANTDGDYGTAVGQGLGCLDAPEMPSTGGSVVISGGFGQMQGDAARYKSDGVYYVNGDVSITSNIEYGSVSGLVLDSLPYIKIVATGNIYISGSVTRLDGIYAAGQTIYTCADGMGAPNLSNPASLCYSNRLTVHGALEADSIKYLRLSGSAGTLNSAAETIIYDPLVWIRGATAVGGATNSGKFDAYTTMPPIL